ncbi:unnamed protein product [Dicrocoelium dendriticum]|nr:unnamed protein product [Dicrocoelium dendriticum]
MDNVKHRYGFLALTFKSTRDSYVLLESTAGLTPHYESISRWVHVQCGRVRECKSSDSIHRLTKERKRMNCKLSRHKIMRSRDLNSIRSMQHKCEQPSDIIHLNILLGGDSWKRFKYVERKGERTRILNRK